MLPMLSRRTAVFEFEIERNCKPNIRSENDVGGVGVLIGFTATALFTLLITLTRYFFGRKFEQHRRHDALLRLSPDYNPHSTPHVRKKTFYKRWCRILNRVLLSLSDAQNITAMSAVIAVYLKYDSLHSYHQLIAYNLPGYAQAANFTALLFLRGSFPERDILLREFLLLCYGILFAWHSIYARHVHPQDCIRDWRVRFRIGSWPSKLAKYIYHLIIISIYMYLLLRRRPKVIYYLSRFLGLFRPVLRFLAWVNQAMARKSSRTLNFLRAAFPKHTVILIAVVVHIGAISIDIWLGLFMANKDLFVTEVSGTVELETDLDWGFGQVLSVALALGLPLYVYQAWSDTIEWQKSIEIAKEPSAALRRQKRTKSNLQRMYESYNLVPPSAEADDGYESELNFEADVPLYKVVLAVNAKVRGEATAEKRKNSELGGFAEVPGEDGGCGKEGFGVGVRPQSTFEERLEGNRRRYARPSFQIHRLRRHVQRHSLG